MSTRLPSSSSFYYYYHYFQSYGLSTRFVFDYLSAVDTSTCDHHTIRYWMFAAYPLCPRKELTDKTVCSTSESSRHGLIAYVSGNAAWLRKHNSTCCTLNDSSMASIIPNGKRSNVRRFISILAYTRQKENISCGSSIRSRGSSMTYYIICTCPSKVSHVIDQLFSYRWR